MMDCLRVNFFTYPEFYVLVPVISIVRSARRNRSGGFWFAGDLALDLFSEFQGPGNLRKNFGRPPGAPHDHCSVTQEPSERGFLDRDAFDSWQEQLDGAAIGERSEEHTSELHHQIISYAVFC